MSTPTFSLAYLEAVRDIRYQMGMSCPYYIPPRPHAYGTESGRTQPIGLGLLLNTRGRDRICVAVRLSELRLRYRELIVTRMRRCMLKWFYFYFRYVLLAAQM